MRTCVAYETIESRAAVDSIAIANSKSVRGTDLSNGDRQRLFLVFRVFHRRTKFPRHATNFKQSLMIRLEGRYVTSAKTDNFAGTRSLRVTYHP